MRKVISWALYLTKNGRFHEYLMGLKANHMAVQLWFPDWELVLYIDDTIDNDVLEYIKSFNDPPFKTILCPNDRNMMVERYRPFLDPKIDISIARDLDSILSKVDADNLNKFIADDSKDAMYYREYQMDSPMGGGMACKKNIIKYIDTITRHFADEPLLEYITNRYVPVDRRTIYTTRMLENGVYHLIDNTEQKPIECQILWTIVFCSGYKLDEYCILDKVFNDIRDMIKYVKKEGVSYKYLHSYVPMYRREIVQKYIWIR